MFNDDYYNNILIPYVVRAIANNYINMFTEVFSTLAYRIASTICLFSKVNGIIQAKFE